MISNYLIELEENLIPGEDDIWSKRLYKSAHHLLAAICFRENSEAVWKNTKTILLPPIGFYYSIFHLSISMLYVDYQTQTDELERITHKNLEKLIDQRLMQKQLISNTYLENFKYFKDLREYANYKFGKKFPKYSYKNLGDSFYTKTGGNFDSAIELIHFIQQKIDVFYSFFYSIQTAIGDGFGDDLIRLYLTTDLEITIQKYLLEKKLTT